MCQRASLSDSQRQYIVHRRTGSGILTIPRKETRWGFASTIAFETVMSAALVRSRPTTPERPSLKAVSYLRDLLRSKGKWKLAYLSLMAQRARLIISATDPRAFNMRIEVRTSFLFRKPVAASHRANAHVADHLTRERHVPYRTAKSIGNLFRQK